ncbi:MAG TPA: hypothetical protein VN048_16495 [Verrucomicrobiae bacterium]|nr:hypothetical protein [Verrucomicrobiae bacterium]
MIDNQPLWRAFKPQIRGNRIRNEAVPFQAFVPVRRFGGSFPGSDVPDQALVFSSGHNGGGATAVPVAFGGGFAFGRAWTSHVLFSADANQWKGLLD